MNLIPIIILTLLSFTAFSQAYPKQDTAKQNADARKYKLEKYKAELKRMSADAKRIEAQVKADSIKAAKQPATKPKNPK